MDRRKFLAVGAAALLAGCDSQNDSTDTPADGTPGGADGTDNGGDTPGGDGTPADTTTEDQTFTPRGDLNATVTFESCTEFTVEADEFTSVWAALANGEVQSWEDGYSGSETFEASSVVNSATVYGPNDTTHESANPDAAECRESE